MRKNAKNDFEKDFYKLMNNSIYGKTMENIRKRSNTFLETDPDHFKKLASQPTFKSCKIFHENLAAVQMTKKKLTLDKPIYAGMCILDISKTLTLREMSNFVEFTGPWYSSTLGESWIGTRRVREREVS